MPQVYNGIGTWYWGKTNIRSSRGTCRFCNRPAELKSYDTTKFFVVVFVPIIPMGQKRVMDECPNCKRHLVLPLKKYEQIRSKEVGGAIEEFRNIPTDPARADLVIGKAVACEAQDEFLQIAPEIERSQERDPRIQARLGMAYAYFGRSAEAEAAYARSYNLRPDPEVGDLLAILYLREGRPDEAAPLLQHVLVDQQREKVGVLYLLVEGYQAAGRHEDALALLTQLLNTFPELSNNAEFTKYRGASLKNRESGRAIRSPNLTPVQARASEHRPLAVMIPRLFAPALILMGLLIYLGVAVYKGQARTVWVVNGLDHDYIATVNGHQVHLPAMGSSKIDIAEGDVTVASADPAVPFPPQTFRISTPLLERPYLARMFVINPDRTAVVYEETTTYRENAGSSNLEIDPHKMYVGEALYSFDNIDYPFEEFPSQLSVENKHTDVYKKKVALLSAGSALGRTSIIRDEIGNDAVGIYARNMAVCNPGDAQFLQIATVLLPPDQALAMLKPRLDARPIQIEVHRAYQTLMERTQPDVDLQREYRNRLAAEPANTTLMYLLARIDTNRDEANKLFDASTKGQPPCAHGYFAMAYDAMSRGEYPRAVELSQKSLDLDPSNEAFRSSLMDAQMAAGEYGQELKIIQDAIKGPIDGSSLLAEVQLLGLLNRGDEARELIAQFMSSHPERGIQNELKAFQARAQATLKYAGGDLNGYLAEMEFAGDAPETKFATAISAGNVDEAANVLSSDKAAGVDEQLLLYLVAASAGRDDVAAPQLKSAIEGLGKTGREGRQAAAWLSAAQAPNPDEVCQITLPPDQKRLVLAAMCLKDPAHKAQYFKAAALMNCNRGFPYLTLKKLLEKAE